VPEVQPKENDELTITFVTDGVEVAVNQAKEAAGDRNVTVVGGANTVEQLLRAGLVDEIELDYVPLLLGSGLRPFGGVSMGDIKLEKISHLEIGQRSRIRFRVVR